MHWLSRNLRICPHNCWNVHVMLPAYGLFCDCRTDCWVGWAANVYCWAHVIHLLTTYLSALLCMDFDCQRVYQTCVDLSWDAVRTSYGQRTDLNLFVLSYGLNLCWDNIQRKYYLTASVDRWFIKPLTCWRLAAVRTYGNRTDFILVAWVIHMVGLMTWGPT